MHSDNYPPNNDALKGLEAFLKVFMVQTEFIKHIPMEILHKYLGRVDQYQEFFNLMVSSLPVDIFKDDLWIYQVAERIEDCNPEWAEKLRNLVDHYNELRTFLNTNGMYYLGLTEYPNPSVDALEIIDIYKRTRKNDEER